jgi:TRAP-type mannitol/chloroaromatic compound transport system substrate-binding protein
MRKERILKFAIGASLAALIAIPFLSSCAAPTVPTPSPEPTPTPSPEPTPTPTPQPAEEQPTWHLRGISPQARSIVERDSIEQYCDIVTEMTGGRVTFDWYAGGELMPSEEEIPALKAGTIDMDQWYPLMGTVTQLNVIECGAPFATDNASAFRTLIYHRGLERLFAESYAELGLVYLGPSLHDPLEIAMSSPAHTLDDLKGKRIQLLKEHAYPFVQAGVVTMPTPPADVYLAIQTGTLDGFGWSGADEIIQFGMNEVAPYLIGPPFVDVCNVAYLINKDVWDSMPPDIQAILKYGLDHLDLWNQSIRNSGETLNRVNGSFTEICTLDDASVEILRSYAYDYLHNEVATRNARCAEAVRIIDDYNAEVGYAGWHPSAPGGQCSSGLMPGFDELVQSKMDTTSVQTEPASSEYWQYVEESTK